MLRSHEGRAVAAHHSALTLLGLPAFRADWQTARLNRVTPGSPRTREGLRLGRHVPTEAIAAIPEGAPFAETVVPALAVVQVGVSAGSLAALVAADAALHQNLITGEDLSTALSSVHFHPRTAQLAPFLQLADGRRESPGETRLGHALHLMCLPVTPQHKVVAPGFLAYPDFVVDGVQVAIEFDGKVKYGRAQDSVTRSGAGSTLRRSCGQRSAARTASGSSAMRWFGSSGRSSTTSRLSPGGSERPLTGPKPGGLFAPPDPVSPRPNPLRIDETRRGASPQDVDAASRGLTPRAEGVNLPDAASTQVG